jgi:hypothetical protein
MIHNTIDYSLTTTCHSSDTPYTTKPLSDHSPIPISLLNASLSCGADLPITARQRLGHVESGDLLPAAVQFFEQQDITQFYTMTFARRTSVESARHRFRKWIDALEWFQHRPLGWLRAEETKHWPGVGTPAIPLHFHGLLIAAPNLNIAQAEALAREVAGDTQVRPYISGGGAIGYSLKQVFQEGGDYDIGGVKAFRPFSSML